MSEHVKHFSEKEFNEKIKSGLVLIDFFAQWCGPCRMITPVLEELAEEMQGKVTIAKIDIDKEVNLASRYQVTSIPTLILFKNGMEITRTEGLKDASSLKKIIEKGL